MDTKSFKTTIKLSKCDYLCAKKFKTQDLWHRYNPLKIRFFRCVFQLLDISRNQLNGIEDSQAIMLQKIKEVRLENNPLICDRCHMGSLIQMVKHVSRFANCVYTFYTNRTFCWPWNGFHCGMCMFLCFVYSFNGVCIQFAFYPNL